MVFSRSMVGGRLACALVAAVLTLGGAGAGAQSTIADQGTFDLSIQGIAAGTLSFAGNQAGKSYAVTGKLQSGGLVGMLRKVRYDATAKGSVSGGRYTPSAYAETANTGKRQSESVMEYRGGVPQVKVYNPPREAGPDDVKPASQGGTVDPLTALYAVLRDVEAGQECAVDVPMFDGRRASRLSLGQRQVSGDAVICAGEYRRVAGFSAEDMAEKTRFPFVLTYAPASEGRMRVVEVSMDSLYGKARLQRR